MPLTEKNSVEATSPFHYSFIFGLLIILQSISILAHVIITNNYNNDIIVFSFIMRGVMQIIFGRKNYRDDFLSYYLTNTSATLYMISGASLIDESDDYSPTLITIPIFCMLISGVLRNIWAFTHRYAGRWQNVAFSSFASILISGGLYYSTTIPDMPWLFATLVAIEFFISGAAVLTIAPSKKT